MTRDDTTPPTSAAPRGGASLPAATVARARVASFQAAATRVCLGKTPNENDLALVGSKERWLLYRRLVRDRFRKMIENALPRSTVALGSAGMDETFDAWLDATPPDSRFIREIVPSFVRHALARPAVVARAPEWLLELLAYECARWEAAYADESASRAAAVAFEFERVPVLHPSVRLFAFRHAVHEAPDDAGAFRRRDVALCVHRRPDFAVDNLALTPFAHDLLENFSRGQHTVAEAVQRVARARGTTIDAAFIEKLSTLLALLLDRDVLLGGRA